MVAPETINMGWGTDFCSWNVLTAFALRCSRASSSGICPELFRIQCDLGKDEEAADLDPRFNQQ